MIHTQHSWVAFAAAVSPLQQITATGYIIPHVGDGPQPVVSYDRDYSAGRG